MNLYIKGKLVLKQKDVRDFKALLWVHLTKQGRLSHLFGAHDLNLGKMLSKCYDQRRMI